MKKIITAIIILFCFSCCVKQKTYYISSSMLREAATIKDSSYFIYRDSATGMEDSLWVYGFLNKFREYGGDDSRLQEFILFQMTNKDSTKRFDYRTFGKVKDVMNKEWIRVSYVELGRVWSFVPLTDPVATHQDIYTQVIDKKDKLVLNGTDYGATYIYQSIDSGSKYITSYYSPSHGLVKFEIKNNTSHNTYELVRSYIAK